MGTPEYNRVAHFVRVIRAGSFTAAAAELGLPKSSLSRSVSNLERELGVRLLHRTTRRLTLTELGHAYYEKVRPAVEALDEAHDAALEHDTNPRGLVRISAAPDFAGLAHVLAQFTRKHPSIELDVRLTTRYVDLLAEGIDIAVRAGRLPDSSLVGRKVGQTELGLLAAPSYLRRRGRPRRIEDLAGHDWVLFRANGHRASLTLDGPDGRQHSVDIRGSFAVDDMGFARAACQAGIGIARLPLGGIVDVLDDGRLERVLPEYSAGGAQLWVVLPTAQYVPRRVALVRDHLVEQLPRLVSAQGRERRGR
jgi:DNA-binding transcriptional LysR family regulator